MALTDKQVKIMAEQFADYEKDKEYFEAKEKQLAVTGKQVKADQAQIVKGLNDMANKLEDIKTSLARIGDLNELEAQLDRILSKIETIKQNS